MGLAPLQPTVTRRSNFGFSLPPPIEIEMELRDDTGSSDAKELGQVGTLRVADPSTFSSEGSESRSEGTNSPCQYGKIHPHGADPSPQEDASEQRYPAQNVDMAPTQGMQLKADAPLVLGPLSRRNSLPLEEWEDSPADPGSIPSEELSETVHGGLPAHSNAPAKMEPLHGEQEARWLGTDRQALRESTGVADVAEHLSDQPGEFRVYPHYVPIPTTAEATSLPFLSGDPLLVLGHDLEKTAGKAEVGGAEHVNQKLQFQLAIHDLSICWRLFKGRDWLDRSASADVQTSHHGSGEGRHHSRMVARGSSYRGVAEGSCRATESRGEDDDASSGPAGLFKPKKAELLDALLENYQDERGGRGEVQAGRRTSRQPKLKRLNQPREAGLARSVQRTGRDTSCMLEIVLEHASLRLDNFHPGPPPSLLSNLLFSIKNFHASDTLTSSRPRKTVQHWRDDVRHPREFQQKMVTVRMTARSPSDHFCPEDTPLGDEIMLKVRLLPVHLAFGQHTVDFLRSFSPQPQPNSSLHVKKTNDGDRTRIKSGASPFFISCCDVGACKVCLLFNYRRRCCS